MRDIMKPMYDETARIVISSITRDKRCKLNKSWEIFWNIKEIEIDNDGNFKGKTDGFGRYLPQKWGVKHA
jgi:hypothetical protein